MMQVDTEAADPSAQQERPPGDGDMVRAIEVEVETILARLDRELAIEEALTRTMTARYGL